MSTLDKILLATIIGMALAITGLVYWTILLHGKTYQRGLSYRMAQDRCRSIVAAITGAWPHLESFLGEQFVKELESKVREMREAEAMLASEYMDNIGMTAQFAPVEVIRYLMARNTELARVDEVLTNWEMKQAAPPRTITIANRVSEALTAIEAIRRVENFGLRDVVRENMENQVKAAIGVCAKYAPSMTYIDSLPNYVEACLDFTRQKAHETGMAVAYTSIKS